MSEFGSFQTLTFEFTRCGGVGCCFFLFFIYFFEYHRSGWRPFWPAGLAAFYFQLWSNFFRVFFIICIVSLQPHSPSAPAQPFRVYYLITGQTRVGHNGEPLHILYSIFLYKFFVFPSPQSRCYYPSVFLKIS